MILQIDDWRFHIDLTTTMDHSASEASDHCTCAYCRNFYATIDGEYPSLRPFLARFGIDIEGPDEMIPYFPPTQCEAYYAVGGRILAKGSGPIMVDDLTLFPQEAPDAMVNTQISGPRFFLLVGLMDLPWVLDEPMEDVVSPANSASFMEKILQKRSRPRREDEGYS